MDQHYCAFLQTSSCHPYLGAMRNYLTILRSICVGACLLWTVPAYAVDTLQVTTPDPVTEGWRWTEFDQSNGLAGPLRNIYEDRDGNVWFATAEEGVQRYDGRTWTTLPIGCRGQPVPRAAGCIRRQETP